MSMTLGNLLNDTVFTDAALPSATLPESERCCVIRGLALDSRRVKSGDLFFAYSGVLADGRQYIAEAIGNGAVAVIVEEDESQEFNTSGFSVPIVSLTNVENAIGKIAATFWGDASSNLTVVAVTGTNGKTSVTQMIAESLGALGEKTAVIGTLGNGVFGQLQQTQHTTPNPLQLQELFADFHQQNVSSVAVEASSHGLVQGRLTGTKINVGVVTNISRDHLDYHGTMKSYQQAKANLVSWPGLQQIILNADDPEVMALSVYAREDVERITFSSQSRVATIYAEDVVFSHHGLTFTLVTPTGRSEIKNKLIGEFNVSNLLAVAAVLHCRRYDLAQIAHVLSLVSPVQGRMEDVGLVEGSGELPGVVVDFAHTPDALEKALTALKPHCHGKLWCVFGCGGERDKGKRPEMGAIAAKYADRMVITADNPRSENVSDIIQDIESGISIGAAYQVELDRSEAVRCAVMNAANDDLILLAGKGHENYQDIGGKKYAYSDRDTAEKVLRERLHGSISGGEQC